jgi:hypothetical protein
MRETSKKFAEWLKPNQTAPGIPNPESHCGVWEISVDQVVCQYYLVILNLKTHTETVLRSNIQDRLPTQSAPRPAPKHHSSSAELPECGNWVSNGPAEAEFQVIRRARGFDEGQDNAVGYDSHPSQRLISKAAFVPPKPQLFDSMIREFCCNVSRTIGRDVNSAST